MRERYIVMLGTEFGTKGGISAVVNVYRAGGLFQRWPIRYLATHREGRTWSKLVLAVGSFMRFAGLLLARRVAALHVHSASRASFWRKSPFLLLAFLSARPVIFHLHGGGFREFFEQDCGPLARTWICAVFGRAAKVVVLSPRWEAWVHSVVPRANTQVIPNPAPAVKARREKLADVDPMLLFLGAIIEKKGVFDLLQAVAVLGKDYPRLRLVLAGSGPAQAQVIERARALGIASQVEMPGWVDAAGREAWLAQADVFVLPSHYEGMPMSILEAMAAGLPVIASDVGGIPEMIDQDIEGLLIAPGDVPSLITALERLLRDVALRKKMGLAAQTKITRCYASNHVLEQIEGIYFEVMGSTFPPFKNVEIKQLV